MNSTYIVDTSVLILLAQHYPKDIFASLWTSIEKLIEDGSILAPREVLKEIEQGGDDELIKWCKKYRRMFYMDNLIAKQGKKS